MTASDRAAPTGSGHSAAPPAWTLRVEVDQPDAVLVTAVDAAGRPAGFASAGPARHDPSGWELYAIGVDALLRGTGAAGALLDAVARPACVVWVECANTRARSFYARHGFAADGAQRLHDSTGTPELRLARAAAGR